MVPRHGLLLSVHSRSQGESPDPETGAGQSPGFWKDWCGGGKLLSSTYFLEIKLLKGDWVREIHWHTSNTKKGKHYVLFRWSFRNLELSLILLFWRNKDNRKFSTRKELIDYLQYQELRTVEFEVQRFRNWNEKLVRDNRVGANKVAKIEARRWVNDVSGEALFDCYLTVRSREVNYNDFTKP